MNLRFRKPALLVAALVGVIVASSGVTAAQAANTTFYWSVQNSGKCLDAEIQSISKPTTKVQVWDCSAKKNKRWVLHREASAVRYTIINVQSGRCLGGVSAASGAHVVVRKCNGSSGQKWTSSMNYSTDRYEWHNGNGGLCLQASGKANGSWARLVDCSIYDRAQQWFPNTTV